MASMRRLAWFVFELAQNPRPLRIGQPCRFRRTVRQPQKKHHAHQHGRHALQQQQPLPSSQPATPIQMQQPSGQPAHHRRRQRIRNVKPAHCLRSLACRKPLRQIKNHAREKSRLRNAQQQPHHVKLDRGPHKNHGHRQQAPRQHDPRQPAPRPKPHQQQVRRNLASRIAQKEQPRTQTKNRG